MVAIALIAQALASDGTSEARAAEERGQELAVYARAELARGRRTALLGMAGMPLSTAIIGAVVVPGNGSLAPPAALLFGTSVVALTLSPWLAASGAAHERDALEALGCDVPAVPLGRIGQGAYGFGAATGMLATVDTSQPAGAYAALGSAFGIGGAWTLGTWEHLRLERVRDVCPMAR